MRNNDLFLGFPWDKYTGVTLGDEETVLSQFSVSDQESDFIINISGF